VNLAKVLFKISGKERKRKVWPVGAVSNTTVSYSIDLANLFEIFIYYIYGINFNTRIIVDI